MVKYSETDIGPDPHWDNWSSRSSVETALDFNEVVSERGWHRCPRPSGVPQEVHAVAFWNRSPDSGNVEPPYLALRFGVTAPTVTLLHFPTGNFEAGFHNTGCWASEYTGIETAKEIIEPFLERVEEHGE